MTELNLPLITAEGVLTGVDKYKAMVDVKSKDFTFESMIHIPDDQIADRNRIGAMIGSRVRIEVHLVDDGDGEAHAYGHAHHDQLSLDNQLLEAAKSGDLVEVERLLEAGADPTDDDSRALQLAAANGHQNVVERLLEAGATQMAIDRALVRAAANGHQNVVERLKQHIASLGG